MLNVKNLTITYDAVDPPIHAVRGVSFAIEKGETLGVIGESGCGKSSMALSLMGLLPGAAVHGDIDFTGTNLTGMTHKKWQPLRWKKIAIVFQNSLETLNPVLPIGEQIGEPVKTHFGLSGKALETRVADLMTRAGLSVEWMHQYPHQLSGGMRQRVLIAMAVSCSPELLIVDEPTTSLDPESSREILDLIHELQAEHGFAMMMISHHLSAVRRMADRVVTMYAGRMVETGPARQVLDNPMHCYTRGLLNASPDFYQYKDLWGIDGEPPAGNDEHTGCPFYPRCCQRADRCRDTEPPVHRIGKTRYVNCHKGGIETFLAAKDIRKTYRLNGKAIEAVKGVDIEIKSGEIVALVGKSGSGKSTLAHVLVNSEDKDTGRVTFRNQEIQGVEATSRPGGIQMVFQDPFSAISGRMRILDVVLEPLQIMKQGDAAQRTETAKEAIARVRLPVSDDFLNRPAHTLSGGQRQRLAVARALVTRPKLLIADEITSMLDPSTQANLVRELKSIQNRYGFAMLYITHDLFLARKIADFVHVMSDGTIVESGPAFQVLEDPSHSVTRSLIHPLTKENRLRRAS
jgi:peptide/nickel transport system ATP-binding protein